MDNEMREAFGHSVTSRLDSLRINRYYSTKEVAELLQVDESTLRRWADSGKLKCFKTPGGHRRFTAKHISEFLKRYQYEVL
jgi:excisionase family DNA binding protein